MVFITLTRSTRDSARRAKEARLSAMDMVGLGLWMRFRIGDWDWAIRKILGTDKSRGGVGITGERS